MNTKNAITHYLSKCKKALKTGVIKHNVITDIQSYFSDYYCKYCNNEDFGYCGLRHRHIKYCVPSIIKYLENKLAKMSI